MKTSSKTESGHTHPCHLSLSKISRDPEWHQCACSVRAVSASTLVHNGSSTELTPRKIINARAYCSKLHILIEYDSELTVYKENVCVKAVTITQNATPPNGVHLHFWCVVTALKPTTPLPSLLHLGENTGKVWGSLPWCWWSSNP